MLALAAIMAVAVIAACTRQAMPKAATAGDAPSPPATPPTRAAPSTPTALAGTPTPAGTRTPAVVSAAPTSPAPAVAASPSGTQYTNARFAFSFRVPPGYRAQSPPVDGDGLSFANPARTATVTAYGASNVGRYSPAQELAQLVKTYQSARDTVSYRFFHSDVIAVSGTTPGGAVFYQREVVYSAVIYTLLWSYPAATKAQYGTLVTQTVDSFVPGPDHSG
jgi:hypothetical protein